MFGPAWLAEVAPDPEPGSEQSGLGAGPELDSGLELLVLELESEPEPSGLASVGARKSAASVSLARWETAAASVPL